MSQPSQFRAVIIASIVMLIMSLFPVLNLLNFICCAGIILGGAAGTYYYSRQLDKIGMAVQNKDGIMIGLLAGIISAILYVIFSTLLIMVTKQNPVEILYKVVDQYGINVPPESEKLLRNVHEEYSTRGFSIMMIGVELFARIISHSIFGPVGGLIVASIMNKRKNAPQQ
jgi:hypothetical protein